jgi:membrane protease YdiL (CAAX protease family)
VTTQSRDARGHARALTVLVLVLFFLWTTWSTQVLPSLPKLDGVALEVQAIVVRIALWVVPCAVYLWRRHQRAALANMRLGLPPTRRHWIVAGFVTAVASFAVSLDVARKLSVPTSEVWQRLLTEFQWAFPTAPLFEELTFRGVLLAELLSLLAVEVKAPEAPVTRRQRAWLANLAASVAFTGLHWPWWIFTGGMAGDFWEKTAGVLLISLVLGMLFIASRSLWPCVVLHWLNNALSGLVQ